MQKTDKELVAQYLKLKAYRRLRKIKFTGKINFSLFGLTIGLIAVLPMIPVSNQIDFVFIDLFDSLEVKYSLVITIYFGILVLLLCYNILLAIINISRKFKYSSLM